ncbi:MAG: phage minor head protein [Thermoguttaceae bacterium]|jgi:SPP1 gp7 family putative phage head morphogenesis protein|nr:phage minor head protein [Thermoguttaceae bacterium]
MNETEERAGWLLVHHNAEVALARRFWDFFRAQTGRLSRQIERLGGISPATAEAMLDPVEEAAELWRRLAVPLGRMIRVGAQTTWLDAQPDLEKAWSGVELDNLVLPQSVKDAIERSLAELGEQQYWIDLQQGTQDKLADLIRDGIDEGLNEWALAKRVSESLLDIGKVRAHALARTEASQALNAGHAAGLDALYADGTVQVKRWLSVLDGDTRPEHAALNGVEVPIPDDFYVGGEPTPYPAHWGLSAGQRVNCRCTTIAVIP